MLNSIQDEDSPDKPKIASIPEMLRSIYVAILANGSVTIKNVYDQMGFLWVQHRELCMIH